MVHHPYQEDLILKTKAKGEELVHDQIKTNVCTLKAAAKGCTKLQQSPGIKYQLFLVFEVRNASTETCVPTCFHNLQTSSNHTGFQDIEKQWKNMVAGKSSRSRGLAKATTTELGFGALHDALAALSVPLIHPYTIDSFEVGLKSG